MASQTPAVVMDKYVAVPQETPRNDRVIMHNWKMIG